MQDWEILWPGGEKVRARVCDGSTESNCQVQGNVYIRGKYNQFKVKGAQNRFGYASTSVINILEFKSVVGRKEVFLLRIMY